MYTRIHTYMHDDRICLRASVDPQNNGLPLFLVFPPRFTPRGHGTRCRLGVRNEGRFMLPWNSLSKLWIMQSTLPFSGLG